MKPSARESFLHKLGYDTPMPANAIVILAGEDAGPRLAAGHELFKQGAAPFIVVTGGLADPPHLLSAGMLRNRLIGAGVHDNRIIVDSESCHTRQQADTTISLAIEKQWQRLILVASPYHQPRACLTFLAALQKAGKSETIRLISIAANQTSQWTCPDGISITRDQLFTIELEKIERYRALGDVASYEDGLKYLEYWGMPKEQAA